MASTVVFGFTAILRYANGNCQRDFFLVLQTEFHFPIAYFAHALMLAGGNHLTARVLAMTADSRFRLARIQGSAIGRSAPVALFALAAVDPGSDGLTYAMRTAKGWRLQAAIYRRAFTRFLIESYVARKTLAFMLARSDVFASRMPSTRRR